MKCFPRIIHIVNNTLLSVSLSGTPYSMCELLPLDNFRVALRLHVSSVQSLMHGGYLCNSSHCCYCHKVVMEPLLLCVLLHYQLSVFLRIAEGQIR